MSTDWRAEQACCLRETERHQVANRSYIDEGVQLLELAQNAQRLFEKQEPREKRRLLNFMVSNCTWKGGELVITFRQPFDILAETAIAHAEKKAADDVADGFLQIWLGIPVENILGLSALESTWGEHRFAAQGNNYFGIHYPRPLPPDTCCRLVAPGSLCSRAMPIA